jgi:hypothetical protein
MTDKTDKTDRTDRLARLRTDATMRVRVGLVVIGIPNVIVGAWALFAPRSWYDDFPAIGQGWVAAFGAFNQHFVQDIGDAYLGFGSLLLFAALRPSYFLVRGALLGFLVFAVPHFLVHVFVRESLSTNAYIGTLAPQAFAIGVAVWLIVASAPLPKEVTP